MLVTEKNIELSEAESKLEKMFGDNLNKWNFNKDGIIAYHFFLVISCNIKAFMIKCIVDYESFCMSKK